MKSTTLCFTGAAGVLFATLATATRADVVGEAIDYSANGTTLQGYIAYDDSNDDKRPGILVVHEWWGHNDYVRQRADMLAELGYTALALDMYGDGKIATHPDDAGKFMNEALNDMDAMTARFQAALETLRNHPTVAADDIAAIGYCFGGGVVLSAARSGMEIDGVASFHGSLQSPIKPEPGSVSARILVLHGGADEFIPPEQVATFTQEMIEAGANYKFVSYPGAHHSFTSEEADEKGQEFDIPVAYDAEADQQSWSEMQAFFDDIFAD